MAMAETAWAAPPPGEGRAADGIRLASLDAERDRLELVSARLEECVAQVVRARALADASAGPEIASAETPEWSGPAGFAFARAREALEARRLAGVGALEDAGSALARAAELAREQLAGLPA